jgi:hypothetical protein
MGRPVSVKDRLLEHVPEGADWVIALYPSGENEEFYWAGIEDADAVALLRQVARQIERRLVPDPDSDTQH